VSVVCVQFYLGGISHPWKIFCAPNYLDHGVAIVGYGVSKYYRTLFDILSGFNAVDDVTVDRIKHIYCELLVHKANISLMFFGTSPAHST